MNDESDYDKKLKKFLLPILRKRSLYWTARNECKRDSRRERGFYECKSCHNLFSSKEVQIDHIQPVVNVKTSWVSWDHFIRSLFCDKSNLQTLCINCHSSKSQIENELRSINKKKQRKKKT